jgi:hypothetical protein
MEVIMSWPKRRKRRDINYQGEVIQKPLSKTYDLGKMTRLLLRGSYEEFSNYSREHQMGEDFIENTWSLYRGDTSGAT